MLDIGGQAQDPDANSRDLDQVMDVVATKVESRGTDISPAPILLPLLICA
jgi:hypothetical protein